MRDDGVYDSFPAENCAVAAISDEFLSGQYKGADAE